MHMLVMPVIVGTGAAATAPALVPGAAAGPPVTGSVYTTPTIFAPADVQLSVTTSGFPVGVMVPLGETLQT